MSYYEYEQALQKLHSKLNAYTARKEFALSAVHQHCSDVAAATLLVNKFMSEFEYDPSIYCELNEIAIRLNNMPLLFKCAPKALQLNKLDASCHYYFKASLQASCQPLDTLLQYLTCIGEHSLYNYIIASELNLDVALEVILDHLKNHSSNTDASRHMRLGNFFLLVGQLNQAETEYRKAITLEADCSIGYANLAFVLRLLQRPSDSNVALGLSNFVQGKYGSAAENFARAVSIGNRSNNIELGERLAESYLLAGLYCEAVTVCAEASKKQRTIKLYKVWIDALKALNETEHALEVAASASEEFPYELFFRFQARMILPVIYGSTQEISKHRVRFINTLRAWKRECMPKVYHKDSRLCDSIRTTNFYLPYQGRLDLYLQRSYGRLLHFAMTSKYPSLSCQASKRFAPRKRRLRIGYVSAFCSWHTVGKLFLGWIQHHNREQFEIYVYHLGPEVDFLSCSFKKAASHFSHLNTRDVAKICDELRSHDLDVLVHLEFGMDVIAAKIAALRLARVQCLTWGHPITSGLPTMDYFISNEAMEPPDGDRHYSETLLRLPNIGVCVPKPTTLSTRTRAEYGLSETKTIYVSPHALFKHLPQYDCVFPSIARLNPNSEFVFIERDRRTIAAVLAFKRRIDEKFREYGLDPDRYIRFLPPQSTENFLRLLSVSDVYLDSIGWSGGMTTLEALGCMLPIVTVPGRFMRGRHSYGCLKQLGVLATVAQNFDDYVSLAVRLAFDKAWRQDVISEQAKNLHMLYDDKECILALEKFYQGVAYK